MKQGFIAIFDGSTHYRNRFTGKWDYFHESQWQALQTLTMTITQRLLDYQRTDTEEAGKPITVREQGYIEIFHCTQITHLNLVREDVPISKHFIDLEFEELPIKKERLLTTKNVKIPQTIYTYECKPCGRVFSTNSQDSICFSCKNPGSLMSIEPPKN